MVHRSAWSGLLCAGMVPDPLTGTPAPLFLPIQVGAGSFVLADKLAYCRFSYRDLLPPPELERWVLHWVKPVLPSAVRVEMAPLVPDSSRLEPVIAHHSSTRDAAAVGAI